MTLPKSAAEHAGRFVDTLRRIGLALAIAAALTPAAAGREPSRPTAPARVEAVAVVGMTVTS